MQKVRIKLNRKGIDALLKSAEVKECLVGHAAEIQARVGMGYETDTHMTPSRVVASVFTTDRGAIKDNLEHKTLLKAVGG